MPVRHAIRKVSNLPALKKRLKASWRLFCRVLWGFQEFFLVVASRIAQYTATKLSPLLLLALLGALWLLICNRYHPQVPGWIATSLSVVCGGVISLLAMSKPITKNKYLVGMVLLFMLIPAVLACWVVLRPEETREEVTYLTLIDYSTGTIFPAKETHKMLGFRPYMVLLEKLYEIGTPADEKGQAWLEKRERHIEAARVDARMDDALILSQMKSLFYKSWAVDYKPVTRHSGVYTSGVSPELQKIDLSNKWTKARLMGALPGNPYVVGLPDDFEMVLPPGMRVFPGKVKDARALILEDAHCKVSFYRGSWHFGISSTTGHPEAHNSLYIQANEIVVTVMFKKFRIGTEGTVKRKKLWIDPLLMEMRDEFVGIRFPIQDQDRTSMVSPQ